MFPYLYIGFSRDKIVNTAVLKLFDFSMQKSGHLNWKKELMEMLVLLL